MIGINQAIKAEVVVVRVVAVVTAIVVPDVTVFIFGLNPVIAPLPDIVSLNAIMLIEDVLIFR